MKRTLVIADETHELEIHRRGGKTVMVWDNEEFPFDIVKVEPTSYSVIMNGHSVGVNIDRTRSIDPDLHGFRASLYDGAYDFTLQDPHKILLAAAMARLMAHPAERERLAARAPEVTARFHPDQVLGRWEEAMARADRAGG